MTITDVLSADRIIPDLRATTKDGVLEELAGLLAGPTGTDVVRLTAVLRERERLNSTAIGEGIAIPHGRRRLRAEPRRRRLRLGRQAADAPLLRSGRARRRRRDAPEGAGADLPAA